MCSIVLFFWQNNFLRASLIEPEWLVFFYVRVTLLVDVRLTILLVDVRLTLLVDDTLTG